MNIPFTEKTKRKLLRTALMLQLFVPFISQSQTDNIRKEIIEHGKVIREAFSSGDLETIKMLHHPDVIKAIGYNDLKNGRDEVMKGISEAISSYSLEFIENSIESILINGDIAIEQTLFSIKGTPKSGGESFIFKGRTMVTYIRHNDSPTGWATIREIIQPAMQ